MKTLSDGTVHGESLGAGAGTSNASLLPPQGQPVGTWDKGTSCGGLCLLAQVMPAHFCEDELGKKLFGSMSAFGISNLLVAVSSLLSSACVRKASWGFASNKVLMKGWPTSQPKCPQAQAI